MTQAKQPEAIKLASEYRETIPADVLHLWAGEVVGELRRLHAENATLRSGYDASRLEIESLRARVQELGQMLRENRSKRIVELEAQLEAIGAGGVEPLRPRQCLHGISEPSGWRPIETAPKNGQCLVWCDTDDGCEVMKLQRDDRGNWIYEGEPTYCHSFYINPTHWMRLPPSPSSADEGGSR